MKKKEKYRIYRACVLSRLLYGLQTAWLTKVAKQKLDGFHAKCCRLIAKIAPAYYSRVPNTDVLAEMGAQRLSNILLEQNFLLGGVSAHPKTQENEHR